MVVYNQKIIIIVVKNGSHNDKEIVVGANLNNIHQKPSYTYYLFYSTSPHIKKQKNILVINSRNTHPYNASSIVSAYSGSNSMNNNNKKEKKYKKTTAIIATRKYH